MGAPEVPARPVEDDLLQPSLETARAPVAPKGSRPWRLGSQVYVAFFGGVLATTAIAFLNGRRLGMEQRRIGAVLGIGALGVATAAAVALLVGVELQTLRILERGIALATFGGQYLVQRTPDRVYHYFTGTHDEDEDYDSLWVPGLIAVVVGGVLQLLLLAPLVE